MVRQRQLSLSSSASCGEWHLAAFQPVFIIFRRVAKRGIVEPGCPLSVSLLLLLLEAPLA
jgi:hypothetical protein